MSLNCLNTKPTPTASPYGSLLKNIAVSPNAPAAIIKLTRWVFSLEGFDPIGRRRQQDLANRPIDADAEISHETELVQFTGIAGLRNYLLQHRREELLNNFCHKLLGYALGRAVELSDEALILEMRKELEHNDDRFSAAVLAVVNSKQFRYHRGRDIAEEN